MQMTMGYSDENFRRDAPWEEKTRKVYIRMTQTLVCDFEIEVDKDATQEEIEEAAQLARITPQHAVRTLTGEDDWLLETEKIETL